MINLRPWRKVSDVYLVWREEDTIDDAREVLAYDAEEAAEDWAEDDDSSSADYTIVRGNEARVCVRLKSDEAAPVVKFIVSGETVPEYTAREVTS